MYRAKLPRPVDHRLPVLECTQVSSRFALSLPTQWVCSLEFVPRTGQPTELFFLFLELLFERFRGWIGGCLEAWSVADWLSFSDLLSAA